MWLGYLVYSLANYAIKLCIETGLRVAFNIHYFQPFYGLQVIDTFRYFYTL